MALLEPTPEAWKAVIKALATKAAIGGSLSIANASLRKHLLTKARAINAASANPEIAHRVHQVARNRFGLGTSIVRSDNALTRHTGPVFVPHENSIVGPSHASRRTSLVLASLDDPAVVAHELGHAMAAKQTPWADKVAPGVRVTAQIGSSMGLLMGSPTLAALMTAAGEAPTLIEEHRANANAKKILHHAVGPQETHRLLRANKLVARVGLAKALANAIITGALAKR